MEREQVNLSLSPFELSKERHSPVTHKNCPTQPIPQVQLLSRSSVEHLTIPQSSLLALDTQFNCVNTFINNAHLTLLTFDVCLILLPVSFL